ncbi:MAG: hypothetical protein DMG88_10455 [Acidobacteria bacterium]|nr:MAG: hypothetical protein DMG88_10455 [Acidobacteriota bacterium]
MGGFRRGRTRPRARGIERRKVRLSSRTKGLLAHAYANIGQLDKAESLFQQATRISTISETYYNYASFLAAHNRNEEAREWAQRILAKKPTMPGYLRRRERPWFRKASSLLKRLN